MQEIFKRHNLKTNKIYILGDTFMGFTPSLLNKGFNITKVDGWTCNEIFNLPHMRTIHQVNALFCDFAKNKGFNEENAYFEVVDFVDTEIRNELVKIKTKAPQKPSRNFLFLENLLRVIDEQGFDDEMRKILLATFIYSLSKKELKRFGLPLEITDKKELECGILLKPLKLNTISESFSYVKQSVDTFSLEEADSCVIIPLHSRQNKLPKYLFGVHNLLASTDYTSYKNRKTLSIEEVGFPSELNQKKYVNGEKTSFRTLALLKNRLKCNSVILTNIEESVFSVEELTMLFSQGGLNTVNIEYLSGKIALIVKLGVAQKAEDLKEELTQNNESSEKLEAIINNKKYYDLNKFKEMGKGRYDYVSNDLTLYHTVIFNSFPRFKVRYNGEIIFEYGADISKNILKLLSQCESEKPLDLSFSNEELPSLSVNFNANRNKMFKSNTQISEDLTAPSSHQQAKTETKNNEPNLSNFFLIEENNSHNVQCEKPKTENKETNAEKVKKTDFSEFSKEEQERLETMQGFLLYNNS